MPKFLITAFLSAWAINAQAWLTPEIAIHEFLLHELGGARLSSQTYEDYVSRVVHLPDAHEEPGWDSVRVVTGFTLGDMRCNQDECDVDVDFSLPNTDMLDGPPVVNEPGQSDYTFCYKILNKSGDWRVVSPDDYPLLSLDAYKGF